MTNQKTSYIPHHVARHAVLYGLFTLMLLFLNGCSDTHAKKPENKNFTESGDYIEFKLGKEEFRIRKAYFKGGGENQFGLLYYAKFWTLLPDFETYDKTKNRYEFVERLGWGRKLYFSLHKSGTSRASLSRIIEVHKKSKIANYSGRLGKYDEMKYELEVYGATTYDSDDYLYRPNGETTVYITCSSKIMNTPSPSCKMMWDVSDSVFADATFSKDYLPQWQEILSNIQRVFNGQSI